MSKRGKTIKLTPTQAVERARSQLGTCRYVLGKGGNDPTAPTPGAECDCSGWVCWVVGIDRKQPGRHASTGGYVSTDAMIAAAKAGRDGWSLVAPADIRPGDIAVYGGQRNAEGKRIKVGHCGVIVAVAPEAERVDWWHRCQVIDCSAGQQRRLGHAITLRPDASVWKRGVVVRYAG